MDINFGACGWCWMVIKKLSEGYSDPTVVRVELVQQWDTCEFMFAMYQPTNYKIDPNRKEG